MNFFTFFSLAISKILVVPITFVFIYFSGSIIEGTISAINKNYSLEIFNLGNNQTEKLSYFIECIEKELGCKAKKKLMPIQPGDVPKTSADIEKAIKKLGFMPKVKIEEGIHNFVMWYRQYYSI